MSQRGDDKKYQSKPRRPQRQQQQQHDDDADADASLLQHETQRSVVVNHVPHAGVPGALEVSAPKQNSLGVASLLPFGGASASAALGDGKGKAHEVPSVYVAMPAERKVLEAFPVMHEAHSCFETVAGVSEDKVYAALRAFLDVLVAEACVSLSEEDTEHYRVVGSYTPVDGGTSEMVRFAVQVFAGSQKDTRFVEVQRLRGDPLVFMGLFRELQAAMPAEWMVTTTPTGAGITCLADEMEGVKTPSPHLAALLVAAANTQTVESQRMGLARLAEFASHNDEAVAHVAMARLNSPDEQVSSSAAKVLSTLEKDALEALGAELVPSIVSLLQSKHAPSSARLWCLGALEHLLALPAAVSIPVRLSLQSSRSTLQSQAQVPALTATVTRLLHRIES